MQGRYIIGRWLKRSFSPEMLSIHSAFAFGVVIALFFYIYSTSQGIVNQTVFLAETTKSSNRQTLLSQEILLRVRIAADQENADLTPLTEMAREFESIHLSVLQGDLWSDDLQNHYFGGSRPLNAMIRQFADLTHQFVNFPSPQRQAIADELNQMHSTDGLFDALKAAGLLFEDVAAAESMRLHDLLRKILITSALIVTAVAAFIVVPSQREVHRAIERLRKKSVSLLKAKQEGQRTNQRLQHMLKHDPLTKLPNRSFMISRLEKLSEKNRALDLGAIFVGLDNFKAINDTIGFEYGDKLLLAVAERLLLCVDQNDQIARIGGDEFFLITTEPVEELTKRIHTSFDEPFQIDGRSISIKASIGTLTTDSGEMCPDQILRNAGLALQAAKIAGGNRIVTFSNELREGVASLRQLQLELRDAINGGQIEPWFQPQINLSDGKLHGVEILARWRHPTRGMLTPDKFFPAAERAGLTVELDHAIWRSAIRWAGSWQAEGLWRPVISLNAAPDTIADPFLIERLLKTMHETHLDLDQVVVEVLETTLIEGSEDMAAINIDSLAECGISLELDDFGTGYASLSKLTQLPLSGIKLDRSLIAPLPDAGADSVVRAILALATELGLKVIAEGIEEIEQAEHLKACGCAVGQGYGFARPMPKSDFDDWLRLNANVRISPVSSSAVEKMRA